MDPRPRAGRAPRAPDRVRQRLHQRNGQIRPEAAVRGYQALRIRPRAIRIRRARVHERPDDLDWTCGGTTADVSSGRVTRARVANVEDAEAIARIYNEGIADRLATFETDPRTTDDIARGLRQRTPRWPTAVGERGGRVVAWASASEYRTRPCYSGVAEFSVYVARDARGTGAGRAAMDALVDECESRGMWKLLSRVFPEN